MTEVLQDDHGRALGLGEKLGQGGEGIVYRLAHDPNFAAKIYLKQMPSDRMRKIQLLASMPVSHLDQFLARPRSLIWDGRRKPRGLIMPIVDRGEDIHKLYTPGSRKLTFPSATWKFLVHVGLNMARAFAAVHQHGLVVGDVNASSVFVLSDGTVRLIDVDSFQVPSPGTSPLLCTVAVPMFLAPELHGATLDKTVRTPDHDCFGLAVMLFQLLMLGRHPYSGRFLGSGDMPLERAVAEDRFAYGARSDLVQMAKPPNALGLELVSPELCAMFEAAFAPRAQRGARPTAAQWIDALTRLQSSLVQCGRSSSHQYLKDLSNCPWCRFEQDVGVALFGVTAAPATRTGAPGVDRLAGEYKRLSDVLAGLSAPAPPPLPTVRAPLAPDPKAILARRIPWHGWVAAGSGLALTVAGAALLAVGGLLLILLGAVIALWGPGSRASLRHQWVSAYRKARVDLDRATYEYRSTSAYPKLRSAKAEAQALQKSWNSIPDWRRQQVQRLEAQKRALQLQRHLESKLIDTARIKGIGPSRVATLSSFGVDTAKDVTPRRLEGVPSIGPVLIQRLVDWRQSCEASFRYQPNQPLPVAALAALDREAAAKRSDVVDKFRHAVRRVEAARQAEVAEVSSAAQRLAAAQWHLKQAELNVREALGKLPN